jgi:hypothetical protein
VRGADCRQQRENYFNSKKEKKNETARCKNNIIANSIIYTYSSSDEYQKHKNNHVSGE